MYNAGGQTMTATRGSPVRLKFPRTNQSSISNGQPFRILNGVGRCTFPCLKMVRFLKKLWKPSKKPVPLENPTHQITDVSAERDRDSGGEYCSRKISELTRPMELIRPPHKVPTTSTMEGILRSQIRTRGVGINNCPCKMPQL